MHPSILPFHRFIATQRNTIRRNTTQGPRKSVPQHRRQGSLSKASASPRSFCHLSSHSSIPNSVHPPPSRIIAAIFGPSQRHTTQPSAGPTNSLVALSDCTPISHPAAYHQFSPVDCICGGAQLTNDVFCSPHRSSSHSRQKKHLVSPLRAKNTNGFYLRPVKPFPPIHFSLTAT